MITFKIKKLSQGDLNVVYKCICQYTERLVILTNDDSYLSASTNDNTKKQDELKDISILKEYQYDLIRKASGKSQPEKRALTLMYHQGVLVSRALKFQIDYGNVDDSITSVASRIYYQITPKL